MTLLNWFSNDLGVVPVWNCYSPELPLGMIDEQTRARGEEQMVSNQKTAICITTFMYDFEAFFLSRSCKFVQCVLNIESDSFFT